MLLANFSKLSKKVKFEPCNLPVSSHYCQSHLITQCDNGLVLLHFLTGRVKCGIFLIKQEHVFVKEKRPTAFCDLVL